MKVFKLTLAGIAIAATGGTWAHGNAGHPSAMPPPVHKEQKDWGIAAEASTATRTITLDMRDNMRFTPAHLEIKEGETVRLRVKNIGKLMHELVIGTPKELAAHAEMMRRHPGMEHDEPYMTHVAPGQKGDIVWTFNRAGEFEFACLIAGHYQAGMKGTIRVTPKQMARHALQAQDMNHQEKPHEQLTH